MKPRCNALASYFYGATSQRMQRLLDAQTRLQAAVQCHPHFALAEYRLGEAFLQEGNLPRALAAFDEATRDDPALGEAYYALAQVRQWQGDQAGAREALAKFSSLQKRVPASDLKLFATGLQ